jgi:hypothetical protein
MSDDKRIVLRATIEANRLCRLKLNDAFDRLKKSEEALKNAKGGKKKYLAALISALDEKLEAKMQSIQGEESGGCIGGDGGSISGGSCAGTD